MGAMRYQPQGALRPANNPYGQRLIAAATPADNLLGVARKSPTITGGPLGVYTPGGSGSYLQSVRPAPVFLGRQGGASPDNANLSFVIVATNIAANTWFYDGQESGGQGARLQTDGSNNLAWFDGTKQQITGVAIPAGARVICISGGAYNGVAPKVWFDGVLGFTGTTDTSGHWNPTPVFRSLFGSGAFPGSNVFNGKGYMIAVLRGLLTDADAAALSANPWQLFDAAEEDDFVAGTSAAQLAASASTGSTGAATLTTSIPMSTSAMTTASGAVALATSLQLITSAQTVTVGSTQLQTSVGLAAFAVATSTASASLSTAMPLSAVSTPPSAGAASIATAVALLGGGSTPASGSAVLTVTPGTNGPWAALASTAARASATLATSLSLSAGGVARTNGAAALSMAVSLAAGAISRASGSAALVTQVVLVSNGSEASSCAAWLSTACVMALAASTGCSGAVDSRSPLTPNARQTYVEQPRVRRYVAPKRVREL